MLKVGDRAPAFKVQDHHGRVQSLDDYKSKKLVLWFYPKADTPGCTKEGCAFRDRQSQFEAKEAAILGVSFDTAAENTAFAKKFGFEFPLLCDVDRVVGMAYGACTQPSDAHAQRIAYVIEDGKITHAYPKVEAASFPETVLGEI